LGGRFINASGASRGEVAKARLRHCERSEAIHKAAKKEWIASRSLSSGAHSRDPLARNDGLLWLLEIEYERATFPVVITRKSL
jgi:hypothetical protein